MNATNRLIMVEIYGKYIKFGNPSMHTKVMARTRYIGPCPLTSKCDLDRLVTVLNIERDTSSYNGGHLW